MCDRSYPKKLAFQYLEDLKNEFERVNGNQIETAARPYAFIKFDTFIQKTKKLYLDTRTQRNIAKLNDELYEVHQITNSELDSTNPPFLKLNLPVLRVKLIMQVSAMVRWFSLSPFPVYKAIQRLTLCHSLKTFAEEVMELVELTSIRDALVGLLFLADVAFHFVAFLL